MYLIDFINYLCIELLHFGLWKRNDEYKKAINYLFILNKLLALFLLSHS